MLLGASGSIGKSTLDIIRKHPDSFVLCGASCHTHKEILFQIACEFQLKEVALTGINKIEELSHNPFQNSSIDLKLGNLGLMQLIEESDADIVLNGIAGSAGLLPSIKALESKKDLALANKETIVMAGDWVQSLAAKNSCKILPVDSEHAAIFELLKDREMQEIDSLWITASGGPFRTRPLETFSQITLKETLTHPTWNMGKKITIDSATMANKGLELIEAVRLFNISPKKVKVIIQPTSQVHSLIKTIEGSFYAQISDPDMKLPILNALSWPKKIQSDIGTLDIFNLNLNFFKPDLERYPMLKLAYQAAETGGDATIIYNAANEAAVQNFIEEKIKYLDIHRVVEKALQKATGKKIESIDAILKLNKDSYKNCYN